MEKYALLQSQTNYSLQNPHLECQTWHISCLRHGFHHRKGHLNQIHCVLSWGTQDSSLTMIRPILVSFIMVRRLRIPVRLGWRLATAKDIIYSRFNGVVCWWYSLPWIFVHWTKWYVSNKEDMGENPKEIRLCNGSILAYSTQSSDTVINMYVTARNTVNRHPSFRESSKEQRSLRKCYLGAFYPNSRRAYS